MKNMSGFGEINLRRLQIFSQNHGRGNIVAWKKSRQRLFKVINGDAFFPLKVWPRDIVRNFWCKPMRDKQVFLLFIFFIGNGGSPMIIAEWIISSLFERPEKEIKRRLYQLSWINENRKKKEHIWYYFDLMQKRQMYLSGNEKNERQ